MGNRPVRGWTVLLCAVLMATGCVTGTVPSRRGIALDYKPGAAPSPRLALLSPTGMAVRSVTQGAVRVDAFEHLLLLTGLDAFEGSLPRGATLTPREATRLLEVLLQQPVTLASFPPRLVMGHLLREVLAEGDVSRDELLRRVERFKAVAVLRPDGYLAWALTGHTQQRVGSVQWKNDAFRSGPFELGRFYSGTGGAFRPVDARLQPTKSPPLAEVHDDADYIGRTLDGADESIAALYHALGQLLTRPLDSVAALRHLPEGVVALVASSPEYLERLRYMTRGEQVKALSSLTMHLLVTFGTAGGSTSTLRGLFAGAEATVPVLTLSAEGALALERVVVPVGKVATVLSGGPGAALILQRAHEDSENPVPAAGPGQWRPAKESMSSRARAYQEQISGHSADEAYWVGSVRFDGFKDGVLLDAKGPGYANKFFDDFEPKSWFKHSGARALVEQAQRQLGVARRTGTPIRWHIAEEKTLEALRRLFQDNNVFGIEMIYTPAL